MRRGMMILGFQISLLIGLYIVSLFPRPFQPIGLLGFMLIAIYLSFRLTRYVWKDAIRRIREELEKP